MTSVLEMHEDGWYVVYYIAGKEVDRAGLFDSEHEAVEAQRRAESD